MMIFGRNLLCILMAILMCVSLFGCAPKMDAGTDPTDNSALMQSNDASTETQNDQSSSVVTEETEEAEESLEAESEETVYTEPYNTTVSEPQDTTDSTTESAVTEPNDAKPTVTEPVATEPAAPLTTTPATEPPTSPPTEPTTKPSTKPGTEPSTEPATEATTAPSTEPPTSPPTEPTTNPSTEPATESPTEAPTEPEPETEPALPDVYDISNHYIGSLEYAILEQINLRRQEAGVAPLSMDAKLCALAAIRAYEASVCWSHTRPDGRSCFSVLQDYGYNNYLTAGENLVNCSADLAAAAIVNIWMNSPGHRDNILTAEFTRAGLGVYYKDGYVWVANLFVG